MLKNYRTFSLFRLNSRQTSFQSRVSCSYFIRNRKAVMHYKIAQLNNKITYLVLCMTILTKREIGE